MTVELFRYVNMFEYSSGHEALDKIIKIIKEDECGLLIFTSRKTLTTI